MRSLIAAEQMQAVVHHYGQHLKNLRHRVQLVKNRHCHQIATLLTFYIDNDVKEEHILEVNQVRKVSLPLTMIRLKTTKKKNKQFMPTKIVTTPLLSRERTTTARTKITTPMTSAITATFKILLQQIHQQIHLRMSPPINYLEN